MDVVPANAATLSFDSSSTSLFVEYTLELVTQFCGVRFRRVDRSAQNVDVYYGNDEKRPCAIRIPSIDTYTAADVPRVPSAGPRAVPSGSGPFPFDLFAAVRFWLLDEGNANKGPTDFDQHSRLLPGHSVQESTGLREVPIVNAYLMLLRDWVEERLNVKAARLLPPRKRCTVVLSHDVDRPMDAKFSAVLPQTAAAVLRGRHRGRAVAHGVVSAAQAVAASVQRPRPRRWIFHDLVDAEERLGFRSTFFLAPTSRFAATGHALDVAYDLSAPRFRTLCRFLREHGFEVGLHVGYSVGDDVERLVKEKQRLEDVSGAEVMGGRHHYWHVGYPFWKTLAAHAEAGLRYDSSIGFNDAPGFRLGIAFPYRPWNPLTQSAIGTVQIPPMAMDGAFFYRGDQEVNRAVAHVARLVEELKRWEGVAALDWHQETSLPTSRQFRPWGEAYLAILELLADDPEVAVQTFPEVLAASSAKYNSNVELDCESG